MQDKRSHNYQTIHLAQLKLNKSNDVCAAKKVSDVINAGNSVVIHVQKSNLIQDGDEC